MYCTLSRCPFFESFHIAHFVLFVSGDKRELDWYLEKILVYQRRLLTPSFMSDIFPIVRNVDGVHREILKNFASMRAG